MLVYILWRNPFGQIGGSELELIGDIANMIELGLKTKKAALGRAALLGSYRSLPVIGIDHHNRSTMIRTHGWVFLHAQNRR